jgi:hypothetical protein
MHRPLGVVGPKRIEVGDPLQKLAGMLEIGKAKPERMKNGLRTKKLVAKV